MKIRFYSAAMRVVELVEGLILVCAASYLTLVFLKALLGAK